MKFNKVSNGNESSWKTTVAGLVLGVSTALGIIFPEYKELAATVAALAGSALGIVAKDHK